MAIAAMLELDEDKLLERVAEFDITCALCSGVAMLSCVKALGAKKAELVKYQTSGDITVTLPAWSAMQE